MSLFQSRRPPCLARCGAWRPSRSWWTARRAPPGAPTPSGRACQSPPLLPAQLQRLCRKAQWRLRPQAGALLAWRRVVALRGRAAGLLSAWAAWGLRPQMMLARRLLAGSDERKSRIHVVRGALLATSHSEASAVLEAGDAATASAVGEAGDAVDQVHTLVVL